MLGRARRIEIILSTGSALAPLDYDSLHLRVLERSIFLCDPLEGHEASMNWADAPVQENQRLAENSFQYREPRLEQLLGWRG